MGVVIIIGALVALTLVGAAYYVVIPYAFNIKAFFTAQVTDPKALQFSETLYYTIGLFPLIFLGAVFLNAYQNSTRQSSIEGFG